jgi:hypothetical protein
MIGGIVVFKCKWSSLKWKFVLTNSKYICIITCGNFFVLDGIMLHIIVKVEWVLCDII